MSEATKEPTPLPWAWQKFGDEWCIVGAHSIRPIVLNVGQVRNGKPSKRVLRMRDAARDLMVEADANHPDAAMIVRSVNSLPALVEAAEAAVKVIYRATPMVDGDDETVGKVVRKLADDMDAVRKQLTAALVAAKGE